MTLKSMSSCTRRSISRVSRIVESRSDNLSNPHRQLESDLVEDMIHFTSGSTQLTREQLMSMHRNRFTTVYQRDFQHPKQQLTKYHSELQLLPNSAEETRTIADQDGVHTNPEVIGWREEMSQLRKSVARLERFNENDQISAPRTRYGSSGPYKSIAVGVCEFLSIYFSKLFFFWIKINEFIEFRSNQKCMSMKLHLRSRIPKKVKFRTT